MAMTTSSSIKRERPPANFPRAFDFIPITFGLPARLDSMDARRSPARFKYFMTKKNWLMLIVLLVLAGVYVFYFTDWFKPKIISYFTTPAAIWPAVRQHRRSRPGNGSGHLQSGPRLPAHRDQSRPARRLADQPGHAARLASGFRLQRRAGEDIFLWPAPARH